MQNKVQISCFFFKIYNTGHDFHDFAVQLQMNRSPRLLGVRCWNLNCNEIGDHIFSFPYWVDTLSSRSPRVSKDRGATRIVFTQWIDLVYMSYQKVRLGSNASGECFLVNTMSSRSNEPSRDRGATRERKLSLVISDSVRCMAWTRQSQSKKGFGPAMSDTPTHTRSGKAGWWDDGSVLGW